MKREIEWVERYNVNGEGDSIIVGKNGVERIEEISLESNNGNMYLSYTGYDKNGSELIEFINGAFNVRYKKLKL